MSQKNKYINNISKIKKIRSKNNTNWMDILRLAFKLDPDGASKIMQKINYDDKKISLLLNQLASSKKKIFSKK
jgi:hypothetical protein